MHFDPAEERIVEGPVAEAIYLEIPLELAVDPMQQVQVELRGDALGIRVRGIEGGLVFLQVHADQQDAARSHRFARMPEERDRFGRREIADGGARKENHLPADRSRLFRD